MRLLIILSTIIAVGSAVLIPMTWADDDHPAHHGGTTGGSSELAREIARARVALAPFATDLNRAKARGYKLQITPMMEDMGYHFMNPDVQGFDVRRPPILVYVGRGRHAQLVAAEWVFPGKPAKPPLPGARYGSFAAACHYEDGTFTPAGREADCAKRSPESGAPFTFWHPDLVTLHLWLWYPNPAGVFNPTNPLIAPFNR